MLKSKIRKLISIALTLVLTSTTLTCSAANVVPVNGRAVTIPPLAPVSKTNIDSKNPTEVVILFNQ